MADTRDRVGYSGDPETNEMDPKMADGSLVRSKDEWGSIIDILHGIENTTQPSKPAQSVSSPTSRLATLSENIESSKMAAATDAKKGQGLQQLDHLVRMMEQMCQIQKQSSRLREQAEYLTAIKDLQELKNESLMQTCKCEAHQRSSDMYCMPDETFSEPESTVGDEMDSRRDVSPPREKRVSRSVKREPKTKGAKKRSRSLDPYRKDTTEPGEKDAEKDRERERGRPGIFSKFERMKEKLTTRRGSVKKHNINKRLDDKQDEEFKANLYMPDTPSNNHFGLQIDGTETKSEDSGIFHVGLDDIINSTRLVSQILPKSPEDLSDNEDVFTSVQPPWNQVDNFSMEVRKGSDFSTGSSSEDYLDLKSKRTAVHLPKDSEPVVLRNPERQQRSEDQDERTVKSSDEKNVRRKMRVRRSASLQDSTSLNSDDDNEDYDKPSKAWEIKEAPAIMQRDKTGHKLLQKTRSNDMDFSDASLDMQTGQDSASTSSIESKAAQKRKYFRKSHRVEEPISPTTDQRIKALAFEMKSPKSSPPEQKRHKVGWEKVKHAVTRKHIGEIGKIKPGTVSMDESLLRSSEEPSSPTDSSLPEDTFAGGRGKGADSQKEDAKQEKERGGPAVMSSPETQSPLTIYESLQANLTEDFAKKMERWDKKKQKHGTTGLSPLEKSKQSSVESCSSEAGNVPTSDLEAERQRGLTEDFYKKLAEWDKLKQHQKGSGMGPNSPKIEPKQKQKGFKEAKKATKSAKGNNKEKEKDKNKTKENTQQQSKSPESSISRKISPPSEAIYTTDNITVFAKQGGKLKLEGASKEFSKKYKEWEKKEKKKKNYPPIKAEDISSPVFEHAQALPRDDIVTPPSPTNSTMNESRDHDPRDHDPRDHDPRDHDSRDHDPRDQDSGDLYVIVHATPVIVEPEFDVVGEAHGTARAGEPVFRTQSAPPSSTAFLQGDSPNTQRAASTEEDVFTPGTSSSPTVPQEKMNRLEQRNSLLAEQLKLDDVNLLAVQEEIVNMDEQLAEISGEKPEACITERRFSTCSSIGESALEAELCDIKMQIAQLEENLKKRPRHKGHPGLTKVSGEVKGQGQVTSAASAMADFQPNTLSSKESQENTTAESTATSRETLIQNDVTQELERSLNEREAIIKLLQARVERQAQEINYLKNGSDLANQFRRAKSFTARDKKTFDPRSMKVIDITLTEKEKCRLLLDDRSESSRSLKTDSTPSLDTLHISAEDIRLDESNREKAFLEKKSTEIQTDDSEGTSDNKASIAREVPSTEKSAQSEQSERTREDYPGLFGPIETKLKHRRTRSTDRPLASSEQQPSNTEKREPDVETALDSLSAKIANETKVQDATMMREKDGEEKGPMSPTAGAKKVTPKFEVVKLADGLKSQTMELSPRSQRRRERQNQDNGKVDEVSLKASTLRPLRKSPESTESKSEVRNRASKIDFKRTERSRPRERTDDSKTSQKDHVNKEDLTARSETENNSQRVSPREEELNPVTKKTSLAEKAEDKKRSTSSPRPIRSTMEASSERQRGRKTQMTRTLSSDTEAPGRPSEKELCRKGERRSSVENLRAAIEKRQRSFSSEMTDSDQESQSNAKKALEMRLGGRINSDRKDPSESLEKQSIRDRREPVLMRSNQKDNSSVSGLRRKFVTQDFNSMPNVPDIGVRTGRKEKERPKEGCVKQMSQAFSSVSVNQQGVSDVRRRSRSSSTRSSPQSLSPASSNSSLNNIVASQIKRLQDKASSSPESPERRTSIQTKTLKDSIPSLYSLQGRLEHRQSLTNIADVRAKFDKKPDSPATSDSSPMPSRTSSPSDARRTARKEPQKPTLVPSVAAARIKYTVSVANSEKSELQKKSVRKNGNATTPHLVAVTESSQSEKSENKDSTVTFTINQKQKRRQNTSQGPARLEENNNNSNNNRNYQNRDARKKASSSGVTEAKEQSRQTNKQESKDLEDHGMTRKNSFSRNDKQRGSLPRQRESSDSSRRGSLTRGKESPKEPARRKSFSKGKESPQSGSRRNSLTKARDSSNESNKEKTISKDLETTQDTSSLNVPGTNQNDEERSRRRRRRRERNAPSPEPPRANAQVEIKKSEADFNSKTEETNPAKSETNKTPTKPEVDANQSSKSMSKQGTTDDSSQMRLHNQSKAEPEFKTGSKQEAKSEAKLDTKLDTKAEVKHETKPEVKTATKSSEVKTEVKPKVKTDAKSEARPEAKPVAKQDFEVKPDAKSQQKHDAKSNLKPEAKLDAPEAKSERGQERRNKREERTRRQREKEVEVNKEKEAAAKLKAEAARAKLKEEIEAARLREKDAKLKAEKESEEAKKTNRVKRRESKRAERKELKTVEKGDPKKEAVVSEVSPNAPKTSVHDVKRQNKKEEQKPSRVTQDIPSKTLTSQDARKTKDEESANMPDLLVQTQKTSGESCVGEDALGGRSARAILTNSALRGAEAAIGHPLPKSSTPEEEALDDATDDRRSRKDATRRSRAINRGSRITKLDIFKRARSVDSSKASKDRSPDRLLGGGGASSRSCSMDRSGKNRDKSPGGEETRKGGSWLSKRTGSISNFLRPSKV